MATNASRSAKKRRVRRVKAWAKFGLLGTLQEIVLQKPQPRTPGDFWQQPAIEGVFTYTESPARKAKRR